MSRAQNIDVSEANRGPYAGTLPLLTLSRSKVLTRIHYSIDHRLYPPREVPNQSLQGESGFVDSSGPILSMYLGMAEEEDKKLAESWQADADGILIFVRLYLLVPPLTPIYQS